MQPRRRSIDGIAPKPYRPPAGPYQPRRAAPVQVKPTPQSHPQPRPARQNDPAAAEPAQHSKKDFQPPDVPDPKPTFLGKLQMPLIIIGGVIMGLAVQSATMGQAAILVYGVAALILRIESRTTFMLALLALITTVIAKITQPASVMSANFASYAFLLLLVGIATSAWEARQHTRLFSKRYRRKHSRY